MRPPVLYHAPLSRTRWFPAKLFITRELSKDLPKPIILIQGVEDTPSMLESLWLAA